MTLIDHISRKLESQLSREKRRVAFLKANLEKLPFHSLLTTGYLTFQAEKHNKILLRTDRGDK
jgi:hypothetical protein